MEEPENTADSYIKGDFTFTRSECLNFRKGVKG